MFQHHVAQYFSQVDVDVVDASEVLGLVDPVDFVYDKELYATMIFENKRAMYTAVRLYYIKKTSQIHNSEKQ